MNKVFPINDESNEVTKKKLYKLSTEEKLGSWLYLDRNYDELCY